MSKQHSKQNSTARVSSHICIPYSTFHVLWAMVYGTLCEMLCWLCYMRPQFTDFTGLLCTIYACRMQNTHIFTANLVSTSLSLSFSNSWKFLHLFSPGYSSHARIRSKRNHTIWSKFYIPENDFIPNSLRISSRKQLRNIFQWLKRANSVRDFICIWSLIFLRIKRKINTSKTNNSMAPPVLCQFLW